MAVLHIQGGPTPLEGYVLIFKILNTFLALAYWLSALKRKKRIAMIELHTLSMYHVQEFAVSYIGCPDPNQCACGECAIM